MSGLKLFCSIAGRSVQVRFQKVLMIIILVIFFHLPITHPPPIQIFPPFTHPSFIISRLYLCTSLCNLLIMTTASLSEKSDIRSEDKPRLKEIINQIEEDPKSYEFREPVPWKELGLIDYPEIIKRPMDLQSARKQLSKGKYRRYEEFFRDLQLIWDNCKHYNIQGSDIYKQAEYMEKVTRKQIQRFKDEVGMGGGKKAAAKKPSGAPAGEGEDEDEELNAEEVPFEKKVQFTEKVRRLTNDGLTKLVKKVKELCPNALEDVDEQKLHIKVDEIERESFDKLEALVDENLKTKGDTGGAKKK